MATKEIEEYYDVTDGKEPRDTLKLAARLAGEAVGTSRVAIDCGCGAGADIAYLRSQGFEVHAFDVEAESVRRCQEKYADDPQVIISQATFADFTYPAASLIAADASLFFCPTALFPEAWRRISGAITTGGVFVGGFLGPRDTMASDDYDADAFWPDVLTFTEEELRPHFEMFDIEQWVEHELDGHTAQGVPHHWHIFSVVARKR